MCIRDSFWPDGARLAVSFSLMFEGGGQPISGAPGFIEEPMEKGLPDLATNGIFQYGVYEGIPRILDLMDKHQVKLSSFMIDVYKRQVLTRRKLHLAIKQET